MADLLLATRNLLRNRRRSLSTLLALALGLVAILLFGGFKTNIEYSMLTAYVRAGGHLQIQHKDYYTLGSGNPTAYAIADYGRIIQAIQADDQLKSRVSVLTPVLRIGGIAGNYSAGVSRTVIGTSFDAKAINAMRLWNEKSVPIVHPHFVLEGAPRDSAIIGVGVARVLQLCRQLSAKNCDDGAVEDVANKPVVEPGAKKPGADEPRGMPNDLSGLIAQETAANKKTGKTESGGARIELLASSGRGAPNVASLNVLAAEDQGFKELDEVSVIMHLDYAQQLVFGKNKPKVTGIMVQLHRTRDQAFVAARIEALLHQAAPNEPLVVRTVEYLNPFFVQSLQLFDLIFGFIFVLIGGIVLFTVGNTMNAAVVERTTEIGTLRALGLRRAGIRRIFVFEGSLMGLAGALVGIVAAVLLAWVVNQCGLTWLPPGSSERLPLQLRVAGEYGVMASAAVTLLVVSVISAWLPAWRAAKLNVVDALRHA